MISANGLSRALLLVGIASLLGCATSFRAYDGPQLPSDKVAVVKGAMNVLPGTTSLSVASINGKGLSPYQTSIEVVPGRYVIGVEHYLHAGGGLVAQGEVVLEALPGKTYQLESKSDGRSVTFSVVEVNDKK